jgi:putative hydrolase of the HAD superfamily
MSGKWILFDGDNTLWNVEALYDQAREQFSKYVLQIIVNKNEDKDRMIDLEFIEKCQRHRDLQLYKTHGYSCSRFARSFEDTMTFLLPDAPAESLKLARSIAMNVFYEGAHPACALDETLQRLGDNNYSLGIISAGERWVQEQRLKEFCMLSKFQAYKIVEHKTANEYRHFCDEHCVDIANSWMIGDSVRSDILPAREAGLKVIHVRSPNWSAEHGKIPASVPSVNTLSDIIPIILSA